MRVFIDTNILVYSKDEASPFFTKVCDALKGLVSRGVSLCIHQQILREYACVVTRPAPKGFGATVDRAISDISEFEGCYQVVTDTEDVWVEWKRLAKESGIIGLRLHDAYIAAVMRCHGIGKILTLNKKDFLCFHGIEPLTPDAWEKYDETAEDSDH